MKRSDWINVKDRLPEHNQAVLVCRTEDNWYSDHFQEDGTLNKKWRWQACKFIKGRNKEEVEKSNYICSEYQYGNNLFPYSWDTFGPVKLFSQEVSYWIPIVSPYDNNDENHSLLN